MFSARLPLRSASPKRGAVPHSSCLGPAQGSLYWRGAGMTVFTPIIALRRHSLRIVRAKHSCPRMSQKPFYPVTRMEFARSSLMASNTAIDPCWLSSVSLTVLVRWRLDWFPGVGREEGEWNSNWPTWTDRPNWRMATRPWCRCTAIRCTEERAPSPWDGSSNDWAWPKQSSSGPMIAMEVTRSKATWVAFDGPRRSRPARLLMSRFGRYRTISV